MFHHKYDALFAWLFRIIATISVLSLCFILFFLSRESYLFFSSGHLTEIISDNYWHPADGDFYLLPMLIGSLLIMTGAMLIAFPLGLLLALFCRFYAPPLLSAFIQRAIEIVAAIPAVIYGFWGVIFIVPPLAQWHAPGTSLLAGILVLILIVLPGITIIIYNSLANIDQAILQNAISLGLGRASTIRHVVMPEIKQSLLTGATLQSGRAIGETLAVLMVCGNIVQMPGSIFDPVRTLTSNIALEMAYALDMHRSALFFSGLVLLLLVLSLSWLADSQQQLDT
ncbi:MAG: phosphate ABC transporter permease subunit PstC [Gammaproteobacteria bacterium]|nr:phosphate ABC transporter permease subunit PstC [Gammaproteobacteria bacterium]